MQRGCLCPPKPCEGGLNLITASIKSIWQIFQGTAQAQKLQTGLASAHSGWWWVTVIHEEKNQITACIPNPFFSFTYLKKRENTSAEQIFQIMSVSCLCTSIEAKAEKLNQKHNCQSLWFTYLGVNSNEQSKEEKEKRTRKIVLLSRALFVVNCHLAVAFSPKCNTTHNWNVVLLGHVGTLLLFKCLIKCCVYRNHFTHNEHVTHWFS